MSLFLEVSFPGLKVGKVCRVEIKVRFPLEGKVGALIFGTSRQVHLVSLTKYSMIVFTVYTLQGKFPFSAAFHLANFLLFKAELT